jgi:hypothetical protein
MDDMKRFRRQDMGQMPQSAWVFRAIHYNIILAFIEYALVQRGKKYAPIQHQLFAMPSKRELL